MPTPNSPFGNAPNLTLEREGVEPYFIAADELRDCLKNGKQVDIAQAIRTVTAALQNGLGTPAKADDRLVLRHSLLAAKEAAVKDRRESLETVLGSQTDAFNALIERLN